MRLVVPPAVGEAGTAELEDLYAAERPEWLRLGFVAALDGGVQLDGRSGGLSSPGDRLIFRLLRSVCDVILVGAGTVRAEGYRDVDLPAELRARRRVRGGGDGPALAVVTGSGRLHDDGPLLGEGSGTRLVLLTTAAGRETAQAAGGPRAEVVVCGDERVDPAAALGALRARELAHVLCEGGPGLTSDLLRHGLVDDVCLTLAAVIAGSGAAHLTTGSPLPQPVRLDLAHLLEDDGTLLGRWRVAF